MEDIDARIDKANEKYVGNMETDGEVIMASPSDFYENTRIGIRNSLSTPGTNGARAKLTIETRFVIKNLKAKYAAAKRKHDLSLQRGDRMAARLSIAQYMQEDFLPAVEAVIRLNSADEVLNSSDILREMDELALVDGNESASGYTKAYVRSIYEDELGQGPSMSDSTVRCCMRDIDNLMQSGNIRTAVGKAEKMLKKIDAGQQIAIDDDYLILQKIAARGR